METNVLSLLIALVGFVGGFVTGSWKLSSTLTGLSSKVDTVSQNVTMLVKDSKIDHEMLKSHEFKINEILKDIEDLRSQTEKRLNDLKQEIEKLKEKI